MTLVAGVYWIAVGTGKGKPAFGSDVSVSPCESIGCFIVETDVVAIACLHLAEFILVAEAEVKSELAASPEVVLHIGCVVVRIHIQSSGIDRDGGRRWQAKQ